MKIIKPNYKLLDTPSQQQILQRIELAARLCYKSEDKIMQGSAHFLIKNLLKIGHHSVFEHEKISIRIICDRGISHELVRHRLCSFSQESTRYANYSKDKFGNEITVIEPCFWKPGTMEFDIWKKAMEKAENTYLHLLAVGASAQEARSVLPNSLKTEIIITTNIREWRHIFSLRSSWFNKKSHPQMIEIMDMIRADFIDRWPILFGD